MQGARVLLTILAGKWGTCSFIILAFRFVNIKASFWFERFFTFITCVVEFIVSLQCSAWSCSIVASITDKHCIFISFLRGDLWFFFYHMMCFCMLFHVFNTQNYFLTLFTCKRFFSMFWVNVFFQTVKNRKCVFTSIAGKCHLSLKLIFFNSFICCLILNHLKAVLFFIE